MPLFTFRSWSALLIFVPIFSFFVSLDLGISLADVTHRSIHFPIINSIPHLPGVAFPLIFALCIAVSSFGWLISPFFLLSTDRDYALTLHMLQTFHVQFLLGFGQIGDGDLSWWYSFQFISYSFLLDDPWCTFCHIGLSSDNHKKSDTPLFPAALQYSPVSVFLFSTVISFTVLFSFFFFFLSFILFPIPCWIGM